MIIFFMVMVFPLKLTWLTWPKLPAPNRIPWLNATIRGFFSVVLAISWVSKLKKDGADSEK